MRRFSAWLICAGLLLAGVPVARGAAAIYLELSGAMQGDIHGEVVVENFQGQILVLDFHHLLQREYSAVPGPKTHEEVIFTVRLNKAAVPLFRALDTQESMDSCVFRFVLHQAKTEYYTVELGSARISAIEPISHEVAGDLTDDFVRVRMGYATMTVHHQSGTNAILVQGKG